MLKDWACTPASSLWDKTNTFIITTPNYFQSDSFEKLCNQLNPSECQTCSNIVSFKCFLTMHLRPRTNFSVVTNVLKPLGTGKKIWWHICHTQKHVSRAKQMLRSKLHTKFPRGDLWLPVFRICGTLCDKWGKRDPITQFQEAILTI